MAARQVREIRVVVDTSGAKGIKEISAGFKKVGADVKKSTDVLTGFQRAFARIQGFTFAGIGLASLVQAADSVQKLTDRLRLSEGSLEGAKRTLGDLTTVAGETKVGIDDIATVYNRLNLSLRETGISTDALLGFTTALQNSFRLSGSTAAEATASTIQLSQGLASGQLRGQELRSVLEQNALAGNLLAKQFNTTRGELLKFAEAEGGLNASGVLAAFANGADELNESARKLQPTISEGLTVAFNRFKVELGETNEQLGLTQKAVALINFTFGNLGSITAATALLLLYSKRVAIATAATTAWAASMALLGKAAIGVTIAFSPLFIGTTLLVGGLALLGAGLVALALDFDGVVKKGREFLEFTGLITKQASDVDKMKDSWFAATSAQNNFVTSSRVGGRILDESLNPSLDEFSKMLIQTSGNLVAMPGPIEKFSLALQKFSAQQVADSKLAFNYTFSLRQMNEQFLLDGNVEKYSRALKKLEIEKIDIEFKKGKLTLEDYNRRLQEIKFGKTRRDADALRLDIGKLNASYLAGKISLNDYAAAVNAAKLDKLNKDLKSGRTTIDAYNKAVSENNLSELNRQLNATQITYREFESGRQAQAVVDLNNQWEMGLIDVYKYNQALVEVSDKFQPGSAFFTGTANYIRTAGTLSQNIANAVTSTFGNLEDAFTDFTKTGKVNFKEFANAVIEDINRIIVRSLIIRPIAQGILGAIPTGGPVSAGATGQADLATGASSSYAAKGAAFDGGRANFFATGGVVTGRTGFSYGGGRKGIMGESGPEGILPLKRSKSGDLGVVAEGGGSAPIINIYNQTSGEVETSERTGPNGERIMDVLIRSKMKEAIADGSMDRTFNQAYGVKRRGN